MAAELTPVHFFDVRSNLPGMCNLPSSSVPPYAPPRPAQRSPAKLILSDIESQRAWSFNTTKTRLVLNFKGIPYTQSFVSYPDITPLLRSLSVTSYPEGPFAYTLPAIKHPQSIRTNPAGAMMDSLPIAVHLDRVFPGPSLFPSGDASYALTLAVGKMVSNAVLRSLVLIIPKVPEILDRRGREYFIKTRSAMFGKPLSELRPTDPETVRAIIEGIRRELETVSQMLRGLPGKTGPFFEGHQACYADLILMAYLAWTERIDKDLWKQLVGVGRGELKVLWDACLPWLDAQGEVKEYKVPT